MTVKQFTNNKEIFPEQDELYNRIKTLIHEYDGEMSVATVVGLLFALCQSLLTPDEEDL